MRPKGSKKHMQQLRAIREAAPPTSEQVPAPPGPSLRVGLQRSLGDSEVPIIPSKVKAVFRREWVQTCLGDRYCVQFLSPSSEGCDEAM